MLREAASWQGSKYSLRGLLLCRGFVSQTKQPLPSGRGGSPHFSNLFLVFLSQGPPSSSCCEDMVARDMLLRRCDRLRNWRDAMRKLGLRF